MFCNRFHDAGFCVHEHRCVQVDEQVDLEVRALKWQKLGFRSKLATCLGEGDVMAERLVAPSPVPEEILVRKDGRGDRFSLITLEFALDRDRARRPVEDEVIDAVPKLAGKESQRRSVHSCGLFREIVMAMMRQVLLY